MKDTHCFCKKYIYKVALGMGLEEVEVGGIIKVSLCSKTKQKVGVNVIFSMIFKHLCFNITEKRAYDSTRLIQLDFGIYKKIL